MILGLFELTAEQAFGFLSGVLLVALGVLVAFLRPRTPPSLLFAAFSALYGVRPIVLTVSQGVGAYLVSAFTQLLAAVALVALVFIFPRPLDHSERRRLWVPLTFAMVVMVAFGFAVPLTVATGQIQFTADRVMESSAQGIILGAQLGFVSFLAARFLSETNADAKRAYALLAAGVAVFPAEVSGFALDQGPFILAACIVGAGTAMVAWLWATRGQASGAARNVALAIAAAGLARAIENASGMSIGIGARAAGALLVAYAVMRTSLFGLDTKVRFAISKSAVAAVFLGVFFVVAQIAQNWFGSAYGPVFGGITAGLLLFAISPIQRVAERVANAAVPVASVGAVLPSRALREGELPTTRDAREDSFRDAVRWALRDGRISRDEEARLHELAHHLGIEGRRAHQVLVDVERAADLKSEGTTEGEAEPRGR